MVLNAFPISSLDPLVFYSFSFSFFFFFFQGNVKEHIPQIFDAVFECTLEMINKVIKQSSLSMVLAFFFMDCTHLTDTVCIY